MKYVLHKLLIRCPAQSSAMIRRGEQWIFSRWHAVPCRCPAIRLSRAELDPRKWSLLPVRWHHRKDRLQGSVRSVQEEGWSQLLMYSCFIPQMFGIRQLLTNVGSDNRFLFKWVSLTIRRFEDPYMIVEYEFPALKNIIEYHACPSLARDS